MTGFSGRLAAWRGSNPAVAEVAVGVGAGALVLVVALWQWGTTGDALLRGLTLGLWLGLVVWLVARRRRAVEERALARAEADRAALRLELARELHDTLAGEVAAIGIQAAAGRRVLATRPAEAAAALERIEVASRAANADLRRMLEALRSDDGDPRSPRPRASRRCRPSRTSRCSGGPGRSRWPSTRRSRRRSTPRSIAPRTASSRRRSATRVVTPVRCR